MARGEIFAAKARKSTLGEVYNNCCICREGALLPCRSLCGDLIVILAIGSMDVVEHVGCDVADVALGGIGIGASI
jgi:hypothetical protein